MRPALIASLLLCLSAAAFFVQARRDRAAVTTIDRAFLTQLCQMPVDAPHESRESDDILAGEHENELVYLARQNDPQALRAFVRCTLHNLSFGGCCCTRGHTYEAVLWDHPGSNFWPALEELPPASQADVLTKVNRYISFETDIWAESAQAYLARHEATKALLPPGWPAVSDEPVSADAAE